MAGGRAPLLALPALLLLVLVLETAARVVTAFGQEDVFRVGDLGPAGEDDAAGLQLPPLPPIHLLPVHVPADLRWEDMSSWRDLPPNAVWCGYQYPNDEVSRRERAYIARVYRIGSLVPGKVTFWGASAAVSNSTYANVASCEVAVVNPRRVLWVAASNGIVPTGAAPAGLARDGTPLYSCKFHLDRRMSMACGAVQRYTDRCVAELDGNLVSSPVYEVLTLLPSDSPFGPPGPPFPVPYPNMGRALGVEDDQMPRPAGRQK